MASNRLISKIVCAPIVLFTLIGPNVFAQSDVSFSIDHPQFDLSEQETISIKYKQPLPEMPELLIVNDNNEIVRVFNEISSRTNTVQWDGKGANDQYISDGVYYPVLKWSEGSQTRYYDPREFSGGETVAPRLARDQNGRSLVFDLEKPARVSIRAGVANGVLLSNLLSWEVRPAGLNVVNWNGMDQDNLQDIAVLPDLEVAIAAFDLADDAIYVSNSPSLTEASGNEQTKRKDYSEYSPKYTRVATRGNDAISPLHYELGNELQAATLDLAIKNIEQVDDIYQVHGPVIVEVNMPENIRWLFDKSQYEIGFFVDNIFVTEQESGYVPLSWLFDPDQLDTGEHILTVNAIAFSGKVAVKSLKFNYLPDQN